jgi:putative thioredoxin
MLGQEGQIAATRDVTTASFRADVIAESSRQPVLVDFWAPWCEPCKQLAPLLEKVVAAAKGKVKLVKMNIDEHPQVAGQLGIQSIPAVLAFQKGQPVDGFMGALPESQIKGFLERLVGPVSGDADDLIAEAEGLLTAGDAQGAVEIFSDAVAIDPEAPATLGGLVRALVAAGELETARETLTRVPQQAEQHAAVVAARAALELAEQAGSVGDLPDLQRALDADPTNHQKRFDLAVALNAQGQRTEAADALLEIIKRDRGWNEDAARRQLLQFFEAWGPADPESLKARRKLSGMLFV